MMCLSISYALPLLFVNRYHMPIVNRYHMPMSYDYIICLSHMPSMYVLLMCC